MTTQKDYHEIEVKFHPVDPHSIREKLQSLNATQTKPERIMRRSVFGVEQNPSLTVTYIRVRDEGGIVRLSTKQYKDEALGIPFQREIDVEVSDFEKTVKILESAGLKRSQKQITRREEWELDGVTICIDFWPHLKPFIEIEGASEEGIQRVAGVLGLKWEEHINGGTLMVYMKEYGWSREEAFKWVKELDFDTPLKRIE